MWDPDLIITNCIPANLKGRLVEHISANLRPSDFTMCCQMAAQNTRSNRKLQANTDSTLALPIMPMTPTPLGPNYITTPVLVHSLDKDTLHQQTYHRSLREQDVTSVVGSHQRDD
jgi:hypothetical protein